MRNLIFLIFLFDNLQVMSAQIPDSLLIMKFDSIAGIIYSPQSDPVKLAANDSILVMLTDFLSTPQSLTFPFDSLKFVKVVSSAGFDFRLITWTVPLSESRHSYYGFLQKISKGVVANVVELKDNGGIRNTDQSYACDNWPGAVYYRMIENKSGKVNIFTMFGWVGESSGKACRIIETLVFKENGEPVFGWPAFQTEQGNLQNRVIFEFTDQVPFHLAYEEQLLPGKRKKHGWMIVFSRLVGNDAALGRFFQAQIPSYDTFDALIFKKDHWQFFQDIDVRASGISSQNPQTSPKQGLFPENQDRKSPGKRD
ncbi:MAG: hypothetical protein IH598_14610 [Bacteroidales bacterium]|nr:hypothetical protein [Bacteroidales bacterium]